MPFAPRKRAASVEEAILSRRSVRAFADTPVPRALVEKLLAIASRAPSGTNIQPWKVRAIAGAVKTRVAEAILHVAHTEGEAALKSPFNYYPVKWREPYLARRRKVGWDLYGLLGLTRDNKAGLARQHARNYAFFDAPVALIFSIDADMEIGSWLDYGMFLQNIMLAARGEGLDTCPQAALANAHLILRRELSIPDTETVVCGMSLGYAADDKVNTLVTVREPLSTFASFEGFES
ncbi:MAG: nitroreductase [Burkholderiales bacterium]